MTLTPGQRLIAANEAGFYSHPSELAKAIDEAIAGALAEIDEDGNFANWLNACDEVLRHGLETENERLRAAAGMLQQSMPTSQFREMVAGIRSRAPATEGEESDG